MSRTIDERIVSMSFDNSKFEKNAKETTSTLESLKEALNFDNIKNSISAMSFVAIGALENLGAKAEETAVRLVKSLSVDQVATGWSKFKQAIASEQTIMSAVEGKLDPEGNAYNMDSVLERINKLKWYSDETSYSIDQMSNAIGNFTASGRDLDESVTAVLGIANACADAGVSTQKAESAFIAFSRAIGSGAMTLGVWNNQLKTSGLTNSERFRTSILEASAAAGILNKTAEGSYELLVKGEKKVVNIANMTDYLNDGIATTEVMLSALNTYSDTVDNIYNLTEGEFSDLEKLYKEAGKEIPKDVQRLIDGTSEISTASQAIDVLTKAYKDLGVEAPKSLKAFTRAQEAIDLTQAIDSVKEAVSSGWSTTFETIFGNYEEGKRLWTDVANNLYTLFADSSWTRNNILSSWKEMWSPLMDERSYLDEYLQGSENNLYNTKTVNQAQGVWRAFAQVLISVRDVVSDLWNTSTGFYFDIETAPRMIFNAVEKLRKKLWEIYDAVNAFATSGSEEINNIRSILRGFSSVIKSLIGLGKTFIDSFITPLKERLQPIAKDILSIFGDLGDIFSTLAWDSMADGFSPFVKICQTLLTILDPIINAISKLVKWVKELTTQWKAQVESGEKTNEFFVSFGTILEKVKELISGFGKGISFVLGLLEKAWGKIKEIAKNLIEVLKNPIGDSDISPAGLAGIFLVFKKIFDIKLNNFDPIATFVGFIKDAVSTITDTIDELQGVLESQMLVNYANGFREIAKTLLMFAASALIIASIDQSKLGSAVGVITYFIVIMGLLGKLLTDKDSGFLNGVSKAASNSQIAKMIKNIGITLLLMAASLKLISTIDEEGIGNGLKAITVLLAEIFGFIKLLGKDQSAPKNMNQLIKVAASMILFGVAMKIIATMSWEEIGKSLVSILGIMAIMAAFIYIAGTIDSGKLVAIGGSMLLIAPSLLVLGATLKLLATMSWEDLGKSLVAMLGVLVIVAGIPALIGTLTGGIGVAALGVFAVSLLLMVPALLGLAGVLKLFSSFSWSTIGKGLGIFAVSLLAISGLSTVLSITTPFILLFSAALKVLGAALKVLGEGIITLIEATVLFSLFKEEFSSNFLSMLTNITAALIEFVPALLLGLLEGIINLGGRLINDLVALLTMIIQALVTAIKDNTINIIEAATAVILSLIEALKELLPEVIILGTTILNSLIDGARLVIPNIIQLGFDIIVALITGFQNAIGDIIQGLFDLLVTAINGLAETIRSGESLFEAIGNLCEAIVEGIVKGLGAAVKTIGSGLLDFGADIVDGIKSFFTGNDENEKSGEETVESIKTGVENKKPELLSTIQETAEEITDTMDRNEEATASGLNTMSGLLTGVTDQGYLDSLFAAGQNAGLSFMSGYDSITATNSPSREMVKRGKFAIQGLIIGLKENFKDVKNSGKEIGKGLLSSIDNSLSLIDDKLNPVITPILDLSEVEKNASMIDGLINQNGEYIPNINYTGVGKNSGLMQGPIALNIDFTVNNDGRDLTEVDLNRFSDMIVNKVDNLLGKLV